MTDAREREGWQLLFDLAQGKGAEVAAWLAVNDPFQDALPCFHQSEDAVRMRALLGMIDPFWSALPCFMAKGVERTGYILRIQARMDFMGVR